MSPGLIRRLTGLALLLAGYFLFPVPTAWTPEAGTPHGHLLIVGGGDTPDAVLQRFVDLAGGAQARIAIFPMASANFASTAPDTEAAEVAADLRAMGVEAHVIHLDREQFEMIEIGELLRTYSGYWFSGGDQNRLATALLSTAALSVIQQRYYEGAVVAGTSAGAAVMSNTMLTGNRHDDPSSKRPAIARGSFEIAPGFGFLPGTIVDQHFLERSRQNRLLSAVLERPDLLGVGIDEGTALLVRPDRHWEVLGESYVKVFDARRAHVMAPTGPIVGSSNITMHLLPSRSVYNPQNGRTLLPAG